MFQRDCKTIQRKDHRSSFEGIIRKKTLDGLLSKPPELVEVCSPPCGSTLPWRAVPGTAWSVQAGRPWEGAWLGVGWMADPLEQIVKRARQEGIELINMKTDINTKVDKALMNQKMEADNFSLMLLTGFLLNGNYQE